MISLVASFPEFLQFLKIVLWISIPLFLLSTGITVIWHYYKRRKNNSLAELLGMDPAMTLVLEEARDVSDPLLNNGLSFRQHYQQQLQAGRDQYELLEKNFRQVKNNYAALLAGSDGDQTNSDEPASNVIQKQLKQYELKIAQLQQALDFLQSNAGNEDDLQKAHLVIKEKEQEIKRLQLMTEQLNKEVGLLNQQNDSKSHELQKMDQQLRELQETARQATADARELKLSVQDQNENRDKHHFEENKKLNEQVNQLHDSFRKLEEENNHLKVKLQETRLEQGMPGDQERRIGELQNALIRAEQEILEWKNKLVDTGSLHEIVEEKKLHIDFLQNQLELRIRTNHQSEQRYLETTNQLSQVQQEISGYQQAFELQQAESTRMVEEITRLYSQIEEGSAENRQLKQDIISKSDQIIVLESEAKNITDRVNEYSEEIKLNKSMIVGLESQLLNTQEQIGMLEKKLAERQDILNRIHQELGSIIHTNPNINEGKDFNSFSLPFLVEEAH